MRYIFLHGLGQSAADWERTVSLLPDAIAADCPELGRFFAGSYRWDELYSAFCRYCDESDEPFGLCGLSLGAVLALHYAADRPERVSALILAAPQYRMPKTLLKIQSAAFRLLPESAFRDSGLPKSAFLSLTASMARLDLTGRLSDISCPALILCGERDRANRKAAERLTELLKKAEFREVPRSGHEINRDDPQTLAGMISEWRI